MQVFKKYHLILNLYLIFLQLDAVELEEQEGVKLTKKPRKKKVRDVPVLIQVFPCVSYVTCLVHIGDRVIKYPAAS